MKTVVSYAYYETDRSMYNLDFFSQNGITERTDILFIIVINGYKCSVELPDYKNCVIIKKENSGFDFGAHKASIDYLLEINNCDANNLPYENYVFMNSGVIGPFLPTYYPSDLYHWTNIFTSKLNDKVKLVGTSLGCFEYTYIPAKGPHIEGFCFCLDKIGLITALEQNTIFVNHLNKHLAVVNGEFLLSETILKAGFTVDCLLYKYNGIDWLNIDNWLDRCKSVFPSRTGTYDNISIHPFEVVFHKYFWGNHNLVNFDYVSTYVKWKQEENINKRKIYVAYGYDNCMINITNKFTKLFIKENKIIIPEKCIFSQHFGDISTVLKSPSYNVHVYICGTLYKLPNFVNKSIELFIDNDAFDITAYYGRDDFKINVTNKFINTFIINNKIIIPQKYSLNACFGDVCPGVVKNLFLTIGSENFIIDELMITNFEFDIVKK